MGDRVRRGYDRAVDVLERLVPVARVLRGALLGYALVVAGSTVAIGAVLLVRDAPDVWFTWLGLVVLVGLLAIAPALLFVFVAMLGAVLELPATLRDLPDVGPARAAELANLVRQARQPIAHGAERPRSVPGDLWRAGRLMMELRAALPLPGPVMAIARWPLLVAVGIALVVGFAQIVAALVVVAAAVVNRLL